MASAATGHWLGWSQWPVKRQLALVEPTLACGGFLYEEGEGLEEEEVSPLHPGPAAGTPGHAGAWGAGPTPH